MFLRKVSESQPYSSIKSDKPLTSIPHLVGAKILHPHIHLYPGTYTHTASPELAALLPRNTFLRPQDDHNDADNQNGNPKIVFGNTFIQAYEGSPVTLTSFGEDVANDWKIVVDREPSVQWYHDKAFRQMLGSVDAGRSTTVVSGGSKFIHPNLVNNGSSSTEKWSSLLLPAGTYIQFPALISSHTSASSAAPASLLIRGSVPYRGDLSRDVATQGWSMDLGLDGWSLGSGRSARSCA